MRSFLPYTLTIWLMAVTLSIFSPILQYKLPQPMWSITLVGSAVLMVLSLRSKERWLS